MSKSKDLTGLIERMQDFEERLGISLESVYSVYKNHGDVAFLIVNYDLRSRGGERLLRNICVKLAVYNSAGRLIHEEGRWHSAKAFYGMESQHFEIIMDSPDIARMRLYPITD